MERELSTYSWQTTKQECYFVSTSTNDMEEPIRFEESDTATGVIINQDKTTKGEDVVVCFIKELKNSGSSPEITRITLEEGEKYTSGCFCISLSTLLKDMEKRKIINNRFLNYCFKKIKNYNDRSSKKN